MAIGSSGSEKSHRHPLQAFGLHLYSNVQANCGWIAYALATVVCSPMTLSMSSIDKRIRMQYPDDGNTYAIETQFFYGPALLINPVTQETSTSVSFYVPQGKWYDFATQKSVAGAGTTITYNNVTTSDIPILVQGGQIVAARVKSAMTTTALRDNDFELLIAPDADGHATGELYLDDGVSLVQTGTSQIVFTYDGNSVTMSGTFNYNTTVGVKSITVMGDSPQTYELDEGLDAAWGRNIGDLKNL